MKKTAFTCAACGTLNIPSPDEHWKGFAPCKQCGSMQSVSARGAGHTSPRLYHEFSRASGLTVSMVLELQKRGLLPRDLVTCNSTHLAIAGALNLAFSSEELLRGAIARVPKNRRNGLLLAVTSDASLTPWQRHILNQYIEEFRLELRGEAPSTAGDKRKRYGSVVTSVPNMILHLEQRHGLPAATSRPWIKRLKNVARTRVRRESQKQASTLKGGIGHE